MNFGLDEELLHPALAPYINNGLFNPSWPLPAAAQLQTPLPALPPTSNEVVRNVILDFHAYWKSKVYIVHSNWKTITDKSILRNLDTKKVSAERDFKNHKMQKFKLGEKVIITTEKRLFKQLHKKVGKWSKALNEHTGKEGIIMRLRPGHIFSVTITDSGITEDIHGFALKKLATPKADNKEKGILQNGTEFKVGDEVTIGVENSVLKYLQEKSRKTPYNIALQLSQLHLIGRVVAFFNGEVVVTFDDINTEFLHPAALQHFSGIGRGNETRLTKIKSMTFKEGDTVTVIDDIRELWWLQLSHGGWNFNVTKVLGKSGEVEDTLVGGDVSVRFNDFESYVMDPRTLRKSKSKQNSTQVLRMPAHLQFKVGDIVKLNITTEDLICTLQLLRIPLSFMPIAGGCMKFLGYIDLQNGAVEFGDGHTFQIPLNLLAKVALQASQQHEQVFKADNEIEVGKEAALFVGPFSFAKDTLKEMRNGFEKALREKGKVCGYEQNGGDAIIKYSDGSLFGIPDEYICSPRDFWLQNQDGTIKIPDWSYDPSLLPRQVSPTECAILHSITEVLKNANEKDALKWTSTIVPQKMKEMKVIDIDMEGKFNDFENFHKLFKSKLEREGLKYYIAEEKICVQAPGETYLLRFNQESENLAVPTITQDCETTVKKSQPRDHFSRSSSVSDSVVEPCQSSNAASMSAGAANNRIISIPSGVQQITLVLNGGQGLQVPPSGALPNEFTGMWPGTTINMFGQGHNMLEINKSNIRSIRSTTMVGEDDDDESSARIVEACVSGRK